MTTKSAADVFTKTGNNPLVAAECLLAAATAAEGKEPAPYTGFISDTVIRKLGYSLVDGSILGLALIVGTPKSAGSCCQRSAANSRKNTCSRSLPGGSSRLSLLPV